MLRITHFGRQLSAPLLAGAVVMASALTLSAAAPAMAWSGELATDDGVLYNTCRDHPYRYEFEVEPGYDQNLTISAEAYGPDGISATSDFDYDIATSGYGSLQFCGYQMAGRYDLEAEVEACNDDYDCYTFDLDSTSFQMRKPRSKTTLTVSPRTPRFNQVVSFRVRSRDERPTGYFSSDGAHVVLEYRAGGHWSRVKASKRYVLHGKATIRYRWNIRQPATIRAKTLTSHDVTSSTSRAVTVRLG